MEKSIYDLLNEVKVDLDDYDKEELNDIEKKKFKKNIKSSIKHKFTYKKALSTAAIIAVLLTTLFATNLGVYAYKTANQIFSNIASYLGIEENLENYSTVINKSITKQGITVKLNEVILDNDELVISATSTCDEKLKKGCILTGTKVYINGKEMSSGAGGSSKQLDEYTSQQVTASRLDAKGLSGDLSIKIIFDMALVNGVEKNGPWEFKFDTNGDELTKSTFELPLSNTFTLPNGQNVTFEKYTSNALGQKIYFSKDSKDTTGAAYDMRLNGHDDLGNTIEFIVARESNSKGMFKISKRYGNLNKNAKTLTLTPYAVKFPEESGEMSNDFKKVGEEFTIALTK